MLKEKTICPMVSNYAASYIERRLTHKPVWNIFCHAGLCHCREWSRIRPVMPAVVMMLGAIPITIVPP